MKRSILFLEILFLSVALVAAFGGIDTFAAVMESTHYQIQSDSVNVGGERSTSASYTLEDTTGEQATGVGSSENYQLYAGYQQMQEVYLALSGGGDVTMAPALAGVTGGTSNGSTTLTAVTDSPSGYQLSIEAAESPALQSDTATIADYQPSGAVPDFAFTTAAGQSHFGFSPEGDDIPARFKDDGVGTCGTGANDTTLACWDGLATTSIVAAERTAPNHPDGTATTLNFRVGIGSGSSQPAGTYVATTTVTLIAL
jgi:hypothetical protein